MKNIIKFFGLLSLIGFSFFYTDKVMDVALEQDSIMIEINQKKDNYKIEPMDAIISEKGMIPGINGREVNVDSSYNNMRSIGVFRENYLVFNKIKPNISMYDYYQKYIIQGNSAKHMVSLIFVLDNKNYLDKLYDVIKNKDVKVNLFVDYHFLNTNTNLMKELKNVHVYSYGMDGVYTADTLLFSKNLIERITKQETNFCLVTDYDIKTLELCSSNKMFTIIPNIIVKNNLYNEIKNKISSGSVILIDANFDNIEGLGMSVDYIRAKGLTIGYLSDLLNEEVLDIKKIS